MKKILLSKINPPHIKGGMWEVLALSFPIVISQACDTIMIFTDRLFLSKLGPELMNAAMGGGLTAFMMISFLIGLIGYTTALVAQHFGANQQEKCPVVLIQACIIAAIGAPLIFICKPLAFKLFDFIGVDPLQLVPQKIYFSIILFAMVISLFRTAISSYFSGIGRTKIVMISSFVAMCVNIGMNYMLIFGKAGFPALGIRGAAFGTIIGGVSGLLVLIIAYLGKKHRITFNVMQSFRFDVTIMKKLLYFGSPAGFEMFLNLLAFNTMVLLFHSRGLIVATAATIMFNWDLVSFLPLIGLEIGITSLVGRYMGAREPDIANRATFSAMKIGMCYSAIILFLFIGFPSILANMFAPNASNAHFTQALPLAIFMIRFASLYVLVESLFFVFIGALRGAGDTYWAMLISVSLHWILVPILYIILKVLHLPPQVGWVAIVCIFCIFSVFVYLRYRTGKWKEIHVVNGA